MTVYVLYQLIPENDHLYKVEMKADTFERFKILHGQHLNVDDVDADLLAELLALCEKGTLIYESQAHTNKPLVLSEGPLIITGEVL